MANLPANPGEALWIGGAAGKNHFNVGIGQGTSGGTNHTDFGQAEIEDGYTDPDKFYLNSAGNTIFRINASAGRTSSGTAHPRSELRELTAGGSAAKWDGRTGDHYMKGRSRITEVTNNRPWVCFFQAHGSSSSPNTSDLFRVQTEGDTGTSTNLPIVCRRSPPSGGSEIRTVLRTGYDVGDWVSWETHINAGRLTITLDGVEVLNVTGMGMVDTYWKMGCYLQDNVEKGASSSSWAAVEVERGSFVTWNAGYPSPTTPVFTGGSDPTGGAGGGSGNDTQPPTVPSNVAGVKGNTQATISWAASTDNIGVDHYNVYRFSASGSSGGDGSATTLGRTTGGAVDTASSTDKMAVSSFTATAGGKLTAGHFRAWLDASGSTSSKMVVYADSSGAPGTRLAVSDQITINTTAEGVRDYVFSGANQITIVSGTTYWIGAAWDDPGTPNLTYSHDGQTGKRTESTATYGTPPTPFGTVSGTFTGPIDAWVDVVSGTGAGTGGGGTTSSFGKQTDGASSSTSSADKTAVSKFTATATGTLIAGHARAWMAAAGSVTVKCVVYADSSGLPGTRLASSDPITVTSTTEAVRDFTFSGAGQIAITNGVDYWLGIGWADPGTPSINYSRDGTASGRQEAGAYAPNPFGTATAQSGPLDVYVDVTSGSGSASGSFVLLTTRTAAQLSYTNTGLTNGVEYQYTVSAVDAAGNESAQSAFVSVTPGAPDTTAPSVPTGLAVTGGDQRGVATWNASTDAGDGVRGYKVYIGGAFVVETTALTYTANSLTNGLTYSFRVSAIDNAGNESAQATAVTVVPTAPTVVGTSLLPGQIIGGKVEVAVAWGANLAADAATWTWSDITTDVRHDPGISTSLGRNDEASRSNPADLQIVLNNTEGAYSLGTGSTHYPYVRRGTPVRVRVDPGDGRGGRVVFFGYADGWTPSWDSLTGKIPVVTLSASGPLRRLAQGSSPVLSAYRRAMNAARATTVVAYWPMEVGSSSDFVPSWFGGGDMAFTGRPDFAADTAFDCSGALPQIKTGAFSAGTVDAYTDTGSTQVRCLLHIGEDGLTDGSVILRISTSGTITQWDITYEVADNGPCFGVIYYDGAGTPSAPVLFLVNLHDIPGRLSFDWKQNGSNVTWTIGWVTLASPDFGTFLNQTVTGKAAGIVTNLRINPLGADLDAAIGHLTVENAITSFFTAQEALVAHVGDYVTAPVSGRLQRLCAENSIAIQSYGASGVLLGALDEMGPQLVAPLLDLLYECETVDQGQLWDGRNAGLSYTTRRRKAAATNTMTVDASLGRLTADFAPVDDDQRNCNRMTVTRLHGVTVTYEDTAGALGTAAIGIYDDSITINHAHDEYMLQYARWFVDLGTVAGYRYPTVTVNLAAAPTLAATALDMMPGGKLTINNLNTTLAKFPDASVALIVEGIAHEINPREWKVTFRCSPFAPWATGLDGA